MKGSRFLGVILVLLVIVAAVAWKLFSGGAGVSGLGGILGKKTEVFGYVGSEKASFLDDEALKKALAARGLSVDYAKAGSIEMVTEEFAKRPQGKAASVDFLWPSSSAALELWRSNPDNPQAASEVAFSSPLVLYTWTEVSDALIKAGYVREEGGVLYMEGLGKLLEKIEAGASWEAVGVPGLFGKAGIVSTDPAKSNSGLLWACLIATTLNGDVPDAAAMKKLLPRIDTYFKRLGYLESSTGNLFEQYLRIGQGQYPLIVGYENQMAEFRLSNPSLWKGLEPKVRVIYPVPTVWSSHPVIALTDGGKAFLKALREPELQALAWRNHGFRAGLAYTMPESASKSAGSSTKEGGGDRAALGLSGLPEEIRRTVPLPQTEAVKVLVSFLQEN